HIVNSFGMTEHNMAEFADALDRLRPEIVVAYVGPMARLARWLLDNGRKPWRPQAILAAAEPLRDFQRDQIEQAFSAPMFNTYGCREFMLIASECERRHGLHVNADHLVVETVVDEKAMPGMDAGEVTITDLHNFGMPFIRYVNGDMATPMRESCRCGRGLPMLASIDGRRLDALRSPEGHILPGEFFPHMLKDVEGIDQFQVVQRQIDRLDISLVRGKGFDESALDYIRDETAKVVGASLKLHFDFVEHIAPGRNGKFRVTRCELE
ncbi:MAG: phenylacetate--CoA ligase family protein, partial [Rhodanobacteraceae bacterium]